MSTNQEIQEALEQQVAEHDGVDQIQLRGKLIRKTSRSQSIDDMLKMQGINSPKRGFSVGRVGRAR